LLELLRVQALELLQLPAPELLQVRELEQRQPLPQDFDWCRQELEHYWKMTWRPRT
jgi:hypothetical protein